MTHLSLPATAVKVAHVCTVDISLRYLLLNQLKTMQAAGYQVWGISAPGVEVPLLASVGIPHLAVPFTRSSSLTPLADLRAFWHLVRLFRRERFTIVHTHTAKPDLYATMAARLAGVPVVLTTLHGFYFHDLMPDHWRRFFMTMAQIGGWFADVVLSQNPEDMTTNEKERVYRSAKMKFLGNGIDVTRFDRQQLDHTVLQARRREIGIPANAPVVGFVGRLVADKGILELLAAAQIIRQRVPEVRFLLVGPVDDAKVDVITPAIAHEYGLEDACIFTGMRQDMPEMFELMDICVLPSHREAFPRSLMEASAMGVPCVATDVRGCRTVVSHNQNGLLVPLGNVPALAEAILYLLQNKEEARRMGGEGRRIALERFDEQKVFATILAEYARLLTEKRLAVPATPSA